MKIARVFPTQTNLSPTDPMAFFGPPDMFVKADEVHISVLFTWDLEHAKWLAKQWERVAPVKIGGPATGQRAENFTPGLYTANGAVITSRGCNNKCWFCSAWRRDGEIRELPITDGWNVFDDNLLQCSDQHIKNVFEMLGRQKRRPIFTGGLEARKLTVWRAKRLFDLNPEYMFFAYDSPRDLGYLHLASKTLIEAGFKRRKMRCYVLIGYPGDTVRDAENRLDDCWDAGYLPMAMLFREGSGQRDPVWQKFQREWVRPAIVKSKCSHRRDIHEHL